MVPEIADSYVLSGKIGFSIDIEDVAGVTAFERTGIFKAGKTGGRSKIRMRKTLFRR
jgi:hypothetical protein